MKIFAGVIAVAAAAMFFFIPAIPQNPEYYNFADSRTMFGLPNFCNVASNLPFFVVGAWGWKVALDHRAAFRFEFEKWSYVTFFAGVFLTGFGSSYFHWNPSTATLLWDRLPMALLFMGFVSGIICDHTDPKVGRHLLVPLVILGVFSVLWWYFGEARGAGDLRLYGIVQFGPLVFIPVLLMVRDSRYSHAWMVWIVAALYGLAKVFEHFDHQLYAVLRLVSGHSIKHMVTAVAAFYVVKMLSVRYELSHVRSKTAK